MSEKLKVIIADDEPLICVVVQKCIHWQELNLELVGIAHDGNELLRMIHENRPDLVITDIDMPEMNGLEMIEQVRKADLDCKFVILSGYRQFEYAHRALKNSVDDYLLKPINEQEINESLQRLKLAVLNERTYGQKAVEHLISKNKEDKENIYRIFMSQMLTRGEDFVLDTEIIEREYGIVLAEGVYQVAFAKLDIKEQEDISDGLSSIQTKLITILNKIFKNECKEIFIYTESKHIILGLYYDKQNQSGMNEKFKTFYEYGKNIVELFIGCTLTVGVSKKHDTVKAFSTALREAQDAICFRMTEGIDQVIFYEQLVIPERRIDQKAMDELQELLYKDFETLDVKSFKNHLSSVFFVNKQDCNVVEMTEITFFILDTFFTCQRELNHVIENAEYTYKKVSQKIKDAVSVSELKQELVNPIEKIMMQLSEEKNRQKRKPIRDAQNYISEHYHENITLDTIAMKVNLNPVYFSNIFKRETGENFVDYLHKYRMKIAREKLREEDISITNLASELGYYDVKYFSKLFKKYVGLKPSDYRKIYG